MKTGKSEKSCDHQFIPPKRFEFSLYRSYVYKASFGFPTTRLSNFANMESGRVLPFLCLIVVCILHLSNGHCHRPNEELKECRDHCNTCLHPGHCYDCSTIGCNCKHGYARNANGICIPIHFCASHVAGDTLLAAESGCNPGLCGDWCRQEFRQGQCVGKSCQCITY